MSDTIKTTRNITNSIFAIPAAAPAIPVNPRTAAIIATTGKTKAQPCNYRIPENFLNPLISGQPEPALVKKTALPRMCGE